MKRFVSSFLAIVLCLTPVLTINAGAISKEQIRDNVEKAWNNTKYGAGRAYNGTVWGLGKTWNGTKYCAGKAYNGTAWGLGKVWNGTKYGVGKAYNGTAWGLGKTWNGTKYYGSKIKKAIEGDLSATPIPRPTSTPVPTQTAKKDNTLKINEDDISVKYFLVEGVGKSGRRLCEQDKAANRSNSTHISEHCKNYYAILDWFAELKKKYPNETNPFWEGLLNERNSQRLVTPTPTPTPTPEVTLTPVPTPTSEWTPTPEITPESTPEVVQVAQIKDEL